MAGSLRALESVAIALLLMACSAPPPETKQVPAAAQRTEASAKATAFDDMTGTMDKARAVQDTADQHQRQLDQALEQAEGK
jgi:hypothetical protein